MLHPSSHGKRADFPLELLSAELSEIESSEYPFPVMLRPDRTGVDGGLGSADPNPSTSG
jgi:hypothetical protein